MEPAQAMTLRGMQDPSLFVCWVVRGSRAPATRIRVSSNSLMYRPGLSGGSWQPAARMFSAQKSLSREKAAVVGIEPGVQNREIREFSEEFFCKELNEMRQDAKGREADYSQLELLINAMGRTFFNILIDEKKSERRVFSIALSDRPDEEVQRILDLGVKEGYFYRSTIGAKDGHGRTARYVLSRRLAPYFALDPTSFAGYLFVTCERLRKAMHAPNVFLRESKVAGEGEDEIQMVLPIEENA